MVKFVMNLQDVDFILEIAYFNLTLLISDTEDAKALALRNAEAAYNTHNAKVNTGIHVCTLEETVIVLMV